MNSRLCDLFRYAAILVVVTAAHPEARAQNLLVNPSFELGSFIDSGDGAMGLAIGSTAITGWTVFNDQIAWITTPNFTPLTAQDGTKFLDLQHPGSTPAPYGGVTQTIATIAGQQYHFSLQLGTLEQPSFDPQLTGPITVTVTAGTSSMPFTFAPPANSGVQWGEFSFDFVASSSSTPISILGTSGKNYLGVDNASLTVVPEPSTMAFGIIGLLIIFTRRNRNTHNG